MIKRRDELYKTCEHKRSDHRKDKCMKSLSGNYGRGSKYCPCKKFKPKLNSELALNHVKQGKPKNKYRKKFVRRLK